MFKSEPVCVKFYTYTHRKNWEENIPNINTE